MSFIADTKSQLAKLMATENITVEHRKIQTAGFDPKSRILYLPIWQNMDGALYDLLCGHEVGHALYTPAEGWHNAITEDSKGKGYKSFLNVVEDARIEKKIKRRYPGLNASFKNAYNELFKKDFFGIKDRDINQMPFIDRLNLFTKSQYTATNIQFSAQEEVFIRRVQELETWQDVLTLTNEIYEYAKQEEETALQEMESEFNYSLPDDYFDDDLLDEEDESEYADDDFDENSEDSDPKSEDSTDVSDEEDTDEENSVVNRLNREKNSGESFEDQFPTCETDDNYRQNETLLVDEKCKNIRYVNLPKPNYNNIVTPAKRVHEILTKEIDHFERNNYFTKARLTTWVNEFKNKNERYVGLLAKEFEMRKAAKSFSKSKLSDTGDIDINKLASYQIDDNIFRKVMVTPKGKSHGLVLVLDKSGSMGNNMAGSIEQILILTMFCRKVNIPFVVYGFGDSYQAYKIDRGIASEVNTDNAFEKKPGNLDLSPVRLREYLNHRMTTMEYNSAIRNMIYVMKSYDDSRSRYDRLPRPESEDLSNTPLTQAIVALAPIMKAFKKNNNLDITNLVIVHDGDADNTSSVIVEKEIHDSRTGQQVMKNIAVPMNPYDEVYILRDRENQFETKMWDTKNKINRSDVVYKNVVKWFKKTTGSKIFSFYLLPSNSAMKRAIEYRYIVEDDRCLNDYRYTYNTGFDWYSKSKELLKKLKTEKFLDCNSDVVDGFYLVAGGSDLKTDDEEIEIEGKVTASKLKTAFMKFNKKRVVNRVLVSKFIAGIAA